MSTKRVKAAMYYGHGRPWFRNPVKDADQNAFFALPADAESYERMVKQATHRILSKWQPGFREYKCVIDAARESAIAALRAIGITQKKGNR